MLETRVRSTSSAPSLTISPGGTPIVGGTPGSVLFVDSSGNLGQDNANFFWDDTNNRLGIGTTSPNTILDQFSDSASATLTNFTQALNVGSHIIGYNRTNSFYTPGIFWYAENNQPTKPKAGIFLLDNAAGSTMLFGTSNVYVTGLTNTALAINDAGNVGIGTTTPDFNLDVSSDAQTISIVQSHNATAANGSYLVLGHTRGTAASPTATQSGDLLGGIAARGYTTTLNNEIMVKMNAAETWAAGAAGTTLSFWTTPNLSLTEAERMTITNAGNVGIGTTSPTETLTIGSSVASTDLSFSFRTADESSNSVRSILTQSANSGFLSLAIDAGGNGSARGYSISLSAVSNAFYINSTGNVGIGTTAPANALDINSATGANLQLTYNDSDGSAANKVNFAVSSSGDLTITPSGGDLTNAARVFNTISNNDPASFTSGLNNVYSVAQIAGAFSGINAGIYGQMNILAANTQNWTGTAGTEGGLGAVGVIGKVEGRTGWSGTVTNANALVSAIELAGGTFTNAVGLRILNGVGTGTITNQYGIYVNALSKGGTLNYAFYSAGAGLVYIGDSTASTSSTTGALVVAGGVGIAKDLFLAGVYVGSTQALSGAGAANVTTETTKITSTGVLDAISLADGVNGQTKIILHDVDGGSFVLTPTTKTGWTTFTSTAAGESIMLKFVTTRGWIVIGSYLGVIA